MIDEKSSSMIVFRVPDTLKNRLKAVAEREQRSVSKVAVRAMELGLDRLEVEGFSDGRSARERGDDFERAVLNVLVAYGLLAAMPDVNPVEPVKARKKSSKR